MADVNASESPLQAAAGAAGSQTVEALRALGNETRLAILLALWEAYEPEEGREPVAFSEIYDRVDGVDTGNFNYHLQ